MLLAVDAVWLEWAIGRHCRVRPVTINNITTKHAYSHYGSALVALLGVYIRYNAPHSWLPQAAWLHKGRSTSVFRAPPPTCISNCRGALQCGQGGMSAAAAVFVGLGHSGRALLSKQYRKHCSGARATRAWNICSTGQTKGSQHQAKHAARIPKHDHESYLLLAYLLPAAGSCCAQPAAHMRAARCTCQQPPHKPLL
jgi:hypothetical protein